MGSLRSHKSQARQEVSVIHILVMGEKLTEEEDLDRNAVLFFSSLNICCWLCQRQSGG